MSNITGEEYVKQIQSLREEASGRLADLELKYADYRKKKEEIVHSMDNLKLDLEILDVKLNDYLALIGSDRAFMDKIEEEENEKQD